MTVWHSLSLVLHLVAAALWIGGIVFFLIAVGPAAHRLEPSLAIKTMDRARIGMENMSWAGIGLILLTGIFSLVARSHADGAAPEAPYFYLLGAKLLVFLAMGVHHGLQVFKYAPALSRLSAQLPPGLDAWPEPLLHQWRRWFLLLKINAALGPFGMLLGLAMAKM